MKEITLAFITNMSAPTATAIAAVAIGFGLAFVAHTLSKLGRRKYELEVQEQRERNEKEILLSGKTALTTTTRRGFGDSE